MKPSEFAQAFIVTAHPALLKKYNAGGPVDPLSLSSQIKDYFDQQKGRIASQAADAKVEGQLEDMATGGLHLETVGLVWLFLSMICTNLPEEIAWVFQRLWA